MSIAVAKACGAAAIFATEVNPQRRAMALTMGAAEALDPDEGDPVARVRAATGGAGVDVLLEMSGNPRAIQSGLAMLRSGGRASLLGIPSEPVTLDLVGDVITKGVDGATAFSAVACVPDLGANDRAAQGAPPQPRSAFPRARAAGKIRRRLFDAASGPGGQGHRLCPNGESR